MIYRALFELADREGLLQDTSYEPKPVHYLLVVGESGQLIEVIEPRDPPRVNKGGRPAGKPTPVVRPVPRRSDRTAQDEPEFLVDKAEYVFGIDPTLKDAGKPKKEAKLANRRRLFMGYVEEALRDIPHSRGLSAVLAFLQAGPPERIRTLLESESETERTALAGALFAFVFEGDGGSACVHDDQSIKAWFRERKEASGLERRGQCLVTGRPGVVLTKLHAKPKGIPPKGTTKGGVPLTSVNAAAFQSYGLDDVGCAPISRDANVAIELALNRLLDHSYPNPRGGSFPRRSVQIGRDTVVLYWCRQEAALDFLAVMDEADPEEVGRLLRAPYLDYAAPLEDSTEFYALVLSGVTGRAVVRSYLETTVREIATGVEEYREQARIVRPFKDEPGGFGLQELRRSLVARGDLDLLPPALGTSLYLRVLDGRPFPRAILEAAVRRNRAGDMEVQRLAARSSLLKAYFNRNREAEDVNVALDAERKDLPYRLGRLLAVLDKVQQDALGGVNATMVDRYFGAASSMPAAVFPTLLRRSQAHVGKLRREKTGLGIRREQLVQEILGELSSFPATLDLVEQGLFALGYYHQRQDFFTKKGEN